jgi:hypothetical protein
VLLALIVSCDADKSKPTDPGPAPELFANLQNRDDVLHNLEVAYNERRPDEYGKLLDDDFVFIFSEVDFNNGEVEFSQWDRVAEMSANEKILNPNLSGDKRVISIELDIEYDEDNWTEQEPNEDHPDESWYFQTVGYNLTLKTADKWEHRARGLQAQFYIRWAEYDNGAHWRIVLWRDDVN